jgi:molybdenum cofactor cytidylyltransferase
MPSSLASDQYSLGVVILAAGRSRRMGRPKLLLPWRETSVLGHLLARWRELQPCQLTVVNAKADFMLDAELDRLAFPTADRIENPTPDLGMFSSIQCAARWAGWKQGLTHWALVLGDQPHLARATLEAVTRWSALHPSLVCQPTFASHRRHPVLLPCSIFLSAANSTASTLKDFLAPAPATYCPVDDPGLELDLDCPEDYATALRLYSTDRLR